AGFFRPLHRRALRHRARVRRQLVRERLITEASRIQQRGVPDLVQIGTAAVPAHLPVVAALVVAITRMQRLMHVADEMHHEAQRLRAFGIAARTVTEHRGVVADRPHHALVAGAIAHWYVDAIARMKIDVVQFGGALAEFRIEVAQVVWPGGDIGEAMRTGHREQPIDLRLCSGCQLRLREVRDDAMADHAPGEGGLRRRERCADEKTAGKTHRAHSHSFTSNGNFKYRWLLAAGGNWPARMFTCSAGHSSFGIESVASRALRIAMNSAAVVSRARCLLSRICSAIVTCARGASPSFG